MPVDLTRSITAAVSQGEASKRTMQARQPQHEVAQRPVEEAAPESSALPASEISVSLDNQWNVIYRFFDPNNGELVRQVPAEEVLKIMRNIENLLQESQQKLKVTL